MALSVALPQRELVAGDHVVEGQHAGEQAGQQQHIDNVAADPAEVGIGGVQQRVGVPGQGALGGLGDLVGTDRDDERPAGDRVEATDTSTAA
jgi:hypothetical protein